MNETQLLNMDKTLQKIKRIAYQIYENNFEEEEIILAGINGQGYYFADFIKKYLNEISDLEVNLALLVFDKSSDVQPEINITSNVDTFRNKVVIVIDDVLNTGRTLAYCLKPFLTIPLKKIQVAVLVDRNHPNYPIAADYVGYALSTTFTDHVKVSLEGEDPKGVFLF